MRALALPRSARFARRGACGRGYSLPRPAASDGGRARRAMARRSARRSSRRCGCSGCSPLVTLQRCAMPASVHLGRRQARAQPAGPLGACGFGPIALLTLRAYSAWLVPAQSACAPGCGAGWRDALRGGMRAGGAAPDAARALRCSGSGWRCCCCGSAALEWTRPVPLRAALPGARRRHPRLRPRSAVGKPGWASPARACCGSRCCVTGACAGVAASPGCAVADAHRLGLDCLRESRRRSASSAPRTAAWASSALREREQLRRGRAAACDEECTLAESCIEPADAS
jgi:hypothetical protein